MKTKRSLESPYPAPPPAERSASPAPERFWREREVPFYVFHHHLNSRTNCDRHISPLFSPTQLPCFQHLEKRVRKLLKTGDLMSLCFAEYAHSFRASPLFATLTQNTPLCFSQLRSRNLKCHLGSRNRREVKTSHQSLAVFLLL